MMNWYCVWQGKVVGFYDSWPAGRRFAVDMAGFAVNIKLLHQFPNATFVYEAGFEEDSFLQDLVTDADFIEAKAENCTQVKFNLMQYNVWDSNCHSFRNRF